MGLPRIQLQYSSSSIWGVINEQIMKIEQYKIIQFIWISRLDNKLYWDELAYLHNTIDGMACTIYSCRAGSVLLNTILGVGGPQKYSIRLGRKTSVIFEHPFRHSENKEKGLVLYYNLWKNPKHLSKCWNECLKWMQCLDVHKHNVCSEAFISFHVES